MISDGACVSEVGRLPYNSIVNNMVDIVAPSGAASACADFCSLYDRRPGYVGFSVRITGTSNLEDYPIGRCQCQFEAGSEQPDLSDAPASTISWWGSTALMPVDVLQGNGNNDYVCYPWIPMAYFCQATQALKIVFVTSEAYNGNLGGLEGANDKCQALATDAGLDVDWSFKAWISLSKSSYPYDPISPLDWNHNGGHPYYLVDGTKIADDWAHLTNALNAELYHEINVNEYGETVTDYVRVWTNTNWNGNRISRFTPDNCDNWNSGNNGKDGRFGSINQKDNEWSWQGRKPCNWLMRLYCIQQDVLSITPTSSPLFCICTNAESYSDGAAGNLTLDAATGALSLNGNSNDLRFHDATTLGTAHDETVTFENIDNFIVPANTIINSFGTNVIKAKRIVIEGTLDGNGGGYPGAVSTTTNYGRRAQSGESPLGTNGHGKGGFHNSGGLFGGGGGGHGQYDNDDF